jgi:hypothetical protein
VCIRERGCGCEVCGGVWVCGLCVWVGGCVSGCVSVRVWVCVCAEL